MFGAIFAVILALTSILVASLTRSNSDRKQAQQLEETLSAPNPFRK